jgi:hypothetical protein
VEAHRAYMHAMSMYKYMRYGKKKVADHTKVVNEDQWRWFNVDQKFIHAIELYNDQFLQNGNYHKIKQISQDDVSSQLTYGKPNQPIFIDLIIKLMLCRVYINVMDKKLLTAEKILGNAEALIHHIEITKHL